jgi:hypothetical protein
MVGDDSAPPAPVVVYEAGHSAAVKVAALALAGDAHMVEVEHAAIQPVGVDCEGSVDKERVRQCCSA